MADEQKSGSTTEQEFWDKAYIAVASAIVAHGSPPNLSSLPDLAAEAADALLDHSRSLKPKGGGVVTAID